MQVITADYLGIVKNLGKGGKQKVGFCHVQGLVGDVIGFK